MRKSSKLVFALLPGVLLASVILAEEIKEVNRTLSLSPKGTLTVKNFKGSITITAWDNPQVQINARIEPDGYSPEEKRKVEDTEILTDASPGSIYIKSDYHKVERQPFTFWGLFNTSTWNLPFVHYSIKVPRTAQVNIKDTKSRIKIADLRSDIKVETFKGTADISDLDGSAELKTHKGKATVQFTNVERRSSFESFKGDIEIILPKGRGFDLDSDLGRRGKLDSDLQLNASLRTLSARRAKHVHGAHRLRYYGTINGGGPLISLKTFKGHFKLRQS